MLFKQLYQLQRYTFLHELQRISYTFLHELSAFTHTFLHELVLFLQQLHKVDTKNCSSSTKWTRKMIIN